MTATSPTGPVQLCVFEVGGVAYAIDIMRVKEIVPAPAVTPVPGTAADGVVDLRDGVVPALDLRRRLGAPADRPAGRLLLIRIGRRLCGLLVDRVREVARLRREELRPAPAMAGDGPAPIVGAFGSGDRLVLLLDVKALLGAGR